MNRNQSLPQTVSSIQFTLYVNSNTYPNYGQLNSNPTRLKLKEFKRCTQFAPWRNNICQIINPTNNGYWKQQPRPKTTMFSQTTNMQRHWLSKLMRKRACKQIWACDLHMKEANRTRLLHGRRWHPMIHGGQMQRKAKLGRSIVC